ncbi:MAG: hypothetical protein AAF699_04365 [Pseudomonadota bacterium]
MRAALRLSVVLWAMMIAGCENSTAKRQCVFVTVSVSVPLEAGWEMMSDLSLPHLYVPGIERTEIVSREMSGSGVHRRVYDSADEYLDETVIEWEEGAGFVLRLHEGESPLQPFERAEFSYAIREHGEQSSLVELAMLTQMPWGGFGEWLGSEFILPEVEDRLMAVAAGLKFFYETGRSATSAERDQLLGEVSSVAEDTACAPFI